MSVFYGGAEHAHITALAGKNVKLVLLNKDSGWW